MQVLPNPEKEARNLRKHGLDFAGVGEVLAGVYLDEPDNRPLGYEHEGRLRILGLLGERVMALIIEPVELETGEIEAKPISFRDATCAEERHFWKWHG
jgi:uncharacterized DUF497 family protein